MGWVSNFLRRPTISMMCYNYLSRRLLSRYIHICTCTYQIVSNTIIFKLIFQETKKARPWGWHSFQPGSGHCLPLVFTVDSMIHTIWYCEIINTNAYVPQLVPICLTGQLIQLIPLYLRVTKHSQNAYNNWQNLLG